VNDNLKYGNHVVYVNNIEEITDANVGDVAITPLNASMCTSRTINMGGTSGGCGNIINTWSTISSTSLVSTTSVLDMEEVVFYALSFFKYASSVSLSLKSVPTDWFIEMYESIKPAPSNDAKVYLALQIEIVKFITNAK